MSKKRIKVGKWKTVFQGQFCTIKQAKAKYPNGETKIWEQGFRIPTVMILAFDNRGRFLLTREYRDKRKRYEWRVPGGRAEDPHLTIKEQAQKELREETGFAAGRLKNFLIWKSSGWNIYVYLATNLKKSSLFCNEAEDITVYFLPFKMVYQMCLEGKIKSAHIAMSIILLYQKNKKR